MTHWGGAGVKVEGIFDLPADDLFPAVDAARLRGVAQLEGVGGDVDVELQAEHSCEPGQGG